MNRLLSAAALWVASSLPSLAADPIQPPPIPPISLPPAASIVAEVRGGVFAHDPSSPEAGGVADVNAEVLFAKPWVPDDPHWSFLAPRPHLGGTVNFAGKTSHAYAGLTWDYDITNAMFVEASVGGSVNDGYTGTVVPRYHNAVGCAGAFRESGSAGYRLDLHWSLMATIEHISNAGLCSRNRGVTNFGGRLGYTF